MVKPKTTRVKKYRIKTDPRLTNLAFKQRLDPMSFDVRFWLTLLDNLERQVISLCLKQGIPTTQLKSYLAYAKKQFKKIDKFSALTLWSEIMVNIDEFVSRGLRESKCMEILSILEDLKFQADYFRKFGKWYQEVYIQDVKELIMFLEQKIKLPSIKEVSQALTQTYLVKDVKIISNALTQSVKIE